MTNDELAQKILDKVGLDMEHGVYVSLDRITPFIEEFRRQAWLEGMNEADSIAWSKRDMWDEGDGYSPTKMAAAEEIGRAIRCRMNRV